MKIRLPVTTAILIACALAAGWYALIHRERAAVLVENGAARKLDADEMRRLQRQSALPGDSGRTTVAAHAGPGVRRSLGTVDQVNRINQLNKKQNGK